MAGPRRCTRPPVAAWALACVLALAGCQGGGSGGEEPAATPSTQAPADVGDKVAYCALAKDLATERGTAGARATDDAEAQERLQQFAADHLEEARRLEALAPGEVKRDVATMVQGIERVADGEASAFAERRFIVAERRVNHYDTTACASP